MVAAAFAEFARLNRHLSEIIEEEHWTDTGPQHPSERRQVAPSGRDHLEGALEKVDVALSSLRRLMAD